jgi:DNA-binding beta-propeller fold protein YncE
MRLPFTDRVRLVLLAMALMSWSAGSASMAFAAGVPTYVGQWGSFGTGPLQFNGPTGIHVGPDGLVYVADNANFRIKVFSNQGSFIREWLCSGGTAVRPWDAVTADGKVYVTVVAHRVFVYTPQGTLLDSWGAYGFCNGEFYMPTSITADGGGNLYITDFGNYRVQKFSSDGEFITQWGSNAPCATPNSESYEFQPFNIAADPSGGVHLMARVPASAGGAAHDIQVQRFSGDGDPLGSWVVGLHQSGAVEPYGVAVNAAGEVFVADPVTHRIRWFSASGTLLGTIGSFGPGPGQFYDPRDLAIDADGDLFVLDAGNNRVQKFTFATAGVPLDGGAIALRAWPNPARGQVSLEFELPQAARCEVGVFDLSGRRVALLDDAMRPAGRHRLEWNTTTDDGSLAAPGVYLYRVNAGGHVRTGRIAILNPGN